MKALDEIYKIYSLLHRSDQKSKQNRPYVFAISKKNFQEIIFQKMLPCVIVYAQCDEMLSKFRDNFQEKLMEKYGENHLQNVLLNVAKRFLKFPEPGNLIMCHYYSIHSFIRLLTTTLGPGSGLSGPAASRSASGHPWPGQVTGSVS